MTVANRPAVDLVAEQLARVPFFAALTPEALSALRHHLVARRFAPGELLFYEGDPCPGFWFVADGLVRIAKLSPDGREQVLCTTRGNACVGCPLLSGGAYMASARALTPVVAVLLPWERVREAAARAPGAGLALLRMLAERHRLLGQVATTLSLRCVTARVARALLDHTREAAGQTVHLSHEEIAASAGTAREVVTRALRDLQRRGVVAVGRRTVVIRDPAALRQIAEWA